MEDHTPAFLRSASALRRDSLQLAQAVEIRRGALAGMSGVLIGFRGERRCLIELNVVPRGVVLIIDCSAVKDRS